MPARGLLFARRGRSAILGRMANEKAQQAVQLPPLIDGGRLSYLETNAFWCADPTGRPCHGSVGCYHAGGRWNEPRRTA